ncbi:GIY-YIG nuclease family protein [Rhodobacteraceae bacterium RKSG542]|uniref:GIY-YIG nuclease family protein n=1 Tax=Pseudovibrio flavus TaxID=2529854 RepID=UPI0012BD032C|nr:GIY-YIG nuclease family protein [Pseudovibrio flavus]MTI17464.1 GIY-YIG nuclease family protein [Pseudovibrio flavus]
MTKGRSLELFFVDGRPDGLLVAELFNWTGHVLLVPRTQLKNALEREETSRTGIYILLGDKDGEPTSYIGESEDIGKRIRTHDSQRDWWTKAVFVTTADNKLNKAHVRYLEARSYERANSVGRVILENSQAPQIPQVSEAIAANMEGFLENLRMILPAIGIDLFVESVRKTKDKLPTKTRDLQVPTIFELVERKDRLKAQARLEDGEFIILSGSQVRDKWVGAKTVNHSYASLREELFRSGIIRSEDGVCKFTADYAFSSPSPAAAVVRGRPAAGPLEWQLEGTSKTYKDWESEQLAEGANELEPA